METKNLELTEEEGKEMVKLFDIAVKAGGLSVANNCLFFTSKIHALFNTKAELPKKEENVAPEAV